MSKETLVSLVGRAALDREFLCQLRDYPAKAVASLNVNLTVEEFSKLRGVDFNELGEFNESASVKKSAAVFCNKVGKNA
jgi:hypothetical protein